MDYQRNAFIIRRGSSSSTDRNEELATAAFERRLIVYLDEWSNRRTLEARVYGATQGERPVLIGFQLDAGYGVAPEQIWKVIDDLDRVLVQQETYEFCERTLPAQYTSQVLKFHAVSPDTDLDMSKHEEAGD
ncbi:hypothetical protein [Paraburkholderia bannensis]|uniref:hypothetical protein n=1 Tax=Paraburkholderia bannensis TaxID=765414 RepID=UPI0004811D23|nr:hypothetical protein [Paraburkholderia bannensis]